MTIPDPANGQYVEFGEGDCCCMLVCLSPPTGGGLGCDEDELDFLLFPACKSFFALNYGFLAVQNIERVIKNMLK